LTVHGEGGLVLPVEMAITALTDGGSGLREP